MSQEKPFTIRSYRKTDRDAVRRLCCQTGFLGTPIDPVYEDRQLFADFLTTYYTDWEPESSFVVEIDGGIRGYLLGSRRPFRNQLYSSWQNVSLFLKAHSLFPISRSVTPIYPVDAGARLAGSSGRAAPRSAFSYQPSARRAQNVDH